MIESSITISVNINSILFVKLNHCIGVTIGVIRAINKLN